MTHDLKAIGRRIATVRREMNLSQKDLAAKINISNNHLSNIETGKSAPGFATFHQLGCRVRHHACKIAGPYCALCFPPLLFRNYTTPSLQASPSLPSNLSARQSP